MKIWASIIAGLVSILQWFQRRVDLNQARQDGRNERDAATLSKITEGHIARDLLSTDADYANKLLKELGVEGSPEANDGQLLSELRACLSKKDRSSGYDKWYIKKLLNIPEAVYRYSSRSLGNLSTCHAELQLIFLELSKEMDVTIICGTRSLEEQDKVFKSGASKVPPGKSKHNRLPSAAVDAVPAKALKLWKEGKDLPVEDYVKMNERVQRIASSYGIKLRWGGDWDMDGDRKDQSFNDLCHWERV